MAFAVQFGDSITQPLFVETLPPIDVVPQKGSSRFQAYCDIKNYVPLSRLIFGFRWVETQRSCDLMRCVTWFLAKKTMAPHLRRLGVGAKTSCLSRFIHPSEHIRNKYPNPIQGHRLEWCVVVRQEVKKVSRRDQLCVVIHHNDFKTSSDDFIELYAVKHYLKVTEEGSPDYFFDHANTELADEEGVPQALPQVVEDALNGQSNETNTLEALRGVVDIDDDKPRP